MLQSVLQNLISNAIKFSLAGGTIALFSQDTPSAVQVSVQDNGTGMNKEAVERLFRMDIKHSTPGTSGEKGTGLGLLLCREFIEKSQGLIFLESKANKVSLISFALPKHFQE